MNSNEQLIQYLKERGRLGSERLKQAFWRIDRADFMREETRALAYEDRPVRIAPRQTISQPYVVALMLELLRPQEGEKVLDVGSGSGWTTALLSELVEAEGKVIALEIIPELKLFGEANASKYNFVQRGIAQFVCADGKKGYPGEAPFDKILCSARAKEVPPAWKEQLRIGGRIVTPISHSIWLSIKKSEGHFEKTEYPDFLFVPLVSEG